MNRPVTLLLACALVAVFIYEVAVGAAGNEAALLSLGALRTRNWAVTDLWRLFTFSFLHLNARHLALNVAALLWIGFVVESRIGPKGELAVFALSAITSGIAGMLLGGLLPTTGIAVGASGAIYGLLAAALMLVFRGPTSATADRRLRRPLIIVLFAALVTSLLPGVSLAGHLGGFAGGAIAAGSIIRWFS